MWCLVLMLFYLLNDKTTMSQVSVKMDEPNHDLKHETRIDNEAWSTNEIIKIINNEVLRLNKLVTNNATTKEGEAIKSEIIKLSNLESWGKNKLDDDYDDNEEIFEDDDIPHYKPMASKIRRHTIPKKNIIKANGTRDIYVVTVNNDNRTAIYVYDEDQNYNDKVNKTRTKIGITHTKLNKFFRNMYNSSVHNFYLLRDQAKDPVFEAYLDTAMDYFTTEYKHEIKTLEIAEKNIDEVIVILECITLVQNLVDNLIIVIKKIYTNENAGLLLTKAIHESFEIFIDKEINYICQEFGICVSADTFQDTYITIIDIILKGHMNKMFSAMKSLIDVFGKNNEHFRKILPSDKEKSESKEFWIDLRKSIKQSTNFDNIPVDSENVALWRKSLSEVQSFVKGGINDLTPTFTAFRNFMKPYYMSESL